MRRTLAGCCILAAERRRIIFEAVSGTLYFAYGSNLHSEDFARYCNERGHPAEVMKPIGPAYLPDHALVFHYRSRARRGGAADVAEHAGRATPGVLFEVSEEGLSVLDEKEGVGARCYAREEVEVLTDDGRSVRALTYKVRPERREGHVPPHSRYYELVDEGLRCYGLPTAGLEAAAIGDSPPAFPNAVFVYGTLLRGEARYPVMRAHGPDDERPGHAPGLLLHLGGFPGLVHEERRAGGRVRGSLFRYSDPAPLLSELDEIEDFLGYGQPGSMYRRSIVKVETEDGEARPAWAYVYVGPRGGAPVIPSGYWPNRRSSVPRGGWRRGLP